MRGNARESPSLFYLDGCPRCGARMFAPFNRLGGPQYAEHFCGQDFRPHKTRFLVTASGTGYVAYEFQPGERVEPVFERWITYWRNTLRFALVG